MPWFKVDDGFHGHPKVVELSLSAVGLWTLAGSWCAKYLTDGHVPSKTVTRLGGEKYLAEELVSADLWLSAPGGYEFKDWAHYQPLKEVVEAERLAAQQRMQKVRAAKKGVRPNDAGTFEDSSPEVRIAPSHPIPVPSSSSTKKRETAPRGTRLDPKWIPTSEDVQKIRTECTSIDPQREHPEFVDYWIAQPGQKGIKVDWAATWRNWMRRKQRDAESGRIRKSKDEQIVDVLEMGRRMQADADRKGIGA
jgi:hypothetical protein